MEERLFGELEVLQAGVALRVRRCDQRAVLALLVLRARPVSCDLLIDQLSGDGQTAKPVNALRTHILQLRRTLRGSAIVISGVGYSPDVGAGDTDVATFENLIAEGPRQSADGELPHASRLLGDAVRLRRGEQLSEFSNLCFANADRAHPNELTLVATDTHVGADLGLRLTTNSSVSWGRCAESTRSASVCGAAHAGAVPGGTPAPPRSTSPRGAAGKVTRPHPMTSAEAIGCSPKPVPEPKVLADPALAPARATTEPGQHHADSFLEAARRRTAGPAPLSLSSRAFDAHRAPLKMPATERTSLVARPPWRCWAREMVTVAFEQPEQA